MLKYLVVVQRKMVLGSPEVPISDYIILGGQNGLRR